MTISNLYGICGALVVRALITRPSASNDVLILPDVRSQLPYLLFNRYSPASFALFPSAPDRPIFSEPARSTNLSLPSITEKDYYRYDAISSYLLDKFFARRKRLSNKHRNGENRVRTTERIANSPHTLPSLVPGLFIHQSLSCSSLFCSLFQ